VRVCVVVSAVAFLIALLSAVGLAWPDFAVQNYAEDMALETATAAFFFAAFCVGAFRIWRHGARDLWLLVASGVALLGFLDELSFGERQFGWQAYELQGTKIDAVHDLLQVARRTVAGSTDHPYLLAALLAGLLVAAVPLLVRWSNGLLAQARDGLSVDVVTFAAALGLIAFSQLLDLHLGPFRQPWIEQSYVEEHMEFGAALLVLAFALTRGRQRWSGA
jgi:hypothetical protein